MGRVPNSTPALARRFLINITASPPWRGTACRISDRTQIPRPVTGGRCVIGCPPISTFWIAAGFALPRSPFPPSQTKPGTWSAQADYKQMCRQTQCWRGFSLLFRRMPRSMSGGHYMWGKKAVWAPKCWGFLLQPTYSEPPSCASFGEISTILTTSGCVSTRLAAARDTRVGSCSGVWPGR